MLNHYLVLSLKVLMRRKFFTFVSIFGISFTLLVLMIATALMDHVFAPVAPETRQDLTLEARRAILFSDGNRGNWFGLGGFTLYDRYARGLPGARYLSIYTDNGGVISYVDGRRVESQMKRTDGDFWNILEFTFVEGRPYSAQEVQESAAVAVINATTRQRFFGETSAVGRTLVANGQTFRVVGVVEDVSALRDVPFADIWAPYTTLRANTYRGSLLGNFKAIVMASTPAARDQIREAFAARVAGINPADYPDGQASKLTRVVTTFDTKFEAFARNFPPFTNPQSFDRQGWRLIAALSALAFLFVLLPTVNLVNVNVSRIMERASEIGIRKAFGASSPTLVWQFVVENLILTLAGGLVGLLLSIFVLRAITESGVIPYAQLGVNWRVFAYGLLLAAAFGLISGVYPAWRMSRLQPVDALRGGLR